jgi:hypothetical protein
MEAISHSVWRVISSPRSPSQLSCRQPRTTRAKREQAKEQTAEGQRGKQHQGGQRAGAGPDHGLLGILGKALQLNPLEGAGKEI